ncbi:MAG: glycosyltransferase family 9 protein [Lentimicrobium sp.]|jgi:ADP-heptose:LPS heptosyltransferase|nr:glycosyltransferase family 9 protein [Lentimicrobium sp.]MDD2528190.1 glycosyltransferase family 9 protein [Lentimicrobiaceae bacterium]MDD4596874.1 glycosyltransferase family 9 protein [Lentimicrobiaceae bacterium]MDY0025818.1 glycosyltransferase family 9 protein [Lentimicrobium sp.]
MENGSPQTLLISRTDSIGDVVLTLPMLGVIKQWNPGIRIVFLGQGYTRPVAEACTYIDDFIDWKQMASQPFEEQLQQFKAIGADAIIHVFPRQEIARLAFRAKIPLRIGTSGRIYHLRTCNRLVVMSRKRSHLHEMQLNLKLARHFIPHKPYPLSELTRFYGLNKLSALPAAYADLLCSEKFNLILHPKSKGSAREWGISNFEALTRLLSAEKYRIFITGTAHEGQMLNEASFFARTTEVVDLTGKLSLNDLIAFIAAADGLIAASTGPLHLSAALGRVTLGIYPPIKPMHPGRWAPLGEKADFLVANKHCNKCRQGGQCSCMIDISPQQVKEKLEQMIISSLNMRTHE